MTLEPKKSPQVTSTDHALSSGLDALDDDVLAEVNHLWTLARALANTAHAVNNSLQVIAGNAELMAAKPDLDPALLRRVQTIATQSERAASTIAALVAYSRPATPGTDSVDTGALVDTLLDMRAHSLARARIKIAVERHDEGSDKVRAPRRLLFQLVLNVLLLVEARLAGRSGATITIRLRRVGPSVTIEVSGTNSQPASHDVSPPGQDLTWMEQRVLPYLAGAAGVSVEQPNGPDRGTSFVLTLPAEDVPA